MQHAFVTSSHYASSNRHAAWRMRTACALDEAKGAACLSLVLATLLSLAGLGQTGWQWTSLVGIPAWYALRSARLV
jgi:hypothetical protein